MPRGDREVLKADIEDGYGKVANLLLEALAHCKLNAKQIGICLFIIRRTYCWKRKKDYISLKEFAQACGTSEQYISRLLSKLIEGNVVLRPDYRPGKTSSYEINTRVAQWYKGCIDVQGLYDCASEGLYNCARVGLHDCARVNQEETVDIHGFEPTGKKVIKERIKENNTSSLSSSRSVPLAQIFAKEFARPITPIEYSQIMAWEKEHTNEVIVEALSRAVLNNKWNFRYIDKILHGWFKNNLRTIEQIREQDEQFQSRNLKVVNGSGSRNKGHPNNQAIKDKAEYYV